MKKNQKTIYISFAIFLILFNSCKSTPKQSAPQEIPQIQEQIDQIDEDDFDLLPDLTPIDEEYQEANTEEDVDLSEVIDCDEAYIILDEQLLNEIVNTDNSEIIDEEPVEEVNNEELQDITQDNIEEQLSDTENQLQTEEIQEQQQSMLENEPAYEEESQIQQNQTTKDDSQLDNIITNSVNQTQSITSNEDTQEVQIILNDDIDYQEEQQEDEETILLQEEVTPSRSIKLKKNQYLDVTYPGTGWIYLGELNNTDLIRYMGRKIGDQNTTFSLRTKDEGTAILHFYRNDPLTGLAINDYLEVISSGINTSAEHVSAPEYSPLTMSTQTNTQSDLDDNLNDKYMSQTNTQNKTTTNDQNNLDTNDLSLKSSATETTTIIQTSDSTAQSNNTEETTSTEPISTTTSLSNLSAEELLKTARDAYNRLEYEEALNYLTEFFNQAITELDEGYYLKGEILESASSVRDIKQAMEAYQEIVTNYPQSVLWQKANEKVTYLKRFYFNIR